jgi:hypothetical protein
MKRILFLLMLLTIANGIIIAQSRVVARGATPGELYMANIWCAYYAPPGPPFYDSVHAAVYHITEHGKKLTIQYDADYFSNPIDVMIPRYILSDASPGVIYNTLTYTNGSNYSQLWVSFDYGKTWIFREENMGTKYYFPANVEKIIFRGGAGEIYKSIDYGLSFLKEENLNFIGKEPGIEEKEVFYVAAAYYNGILTHTYDYFETYTQIPIDSQYMFGQVGGLFPDVYRGGKEGEVYVSSRFPDWRYKISFSADTGHTFRHVFVSDPDPEGNSTPVFMSDREPGVFYLLRYYYVEDFNPLGWHIKVCIEYYRDYGETLMATYCHDLTKDYGSTCEAVTNLTSEKCNENCVLLTWSEPESGLPVLGYQVFRNEQLLNEQLIIETTYYDENLPAGECEYYVVAHYEMGCVSDSSNHVRESIELGVKEYGEGIEVYPNPTSGELIIKNEKLGIESVEVYDMYGRKLPLHFGEGWGEVNISHLQSGIYFVKITTKKGVVVRKVVKY